MPAPLWVLVPVWVLVLAWLLGTALAQLPGTIGMLPRRLDPLGLIPAWTFFAPRPGISDPVIVGRNRLSDSSYSSWVVLWREPEQPLRCLWRPQKRISKLVSDCGSSLRQMDPTGPAVFSVPYLLIGFLASERMVHDIRAVSWQFAIVDLAEWFGKGDPRVLFWFRSQEFELEAVDLCRVVMP